MTTTTETPIVCMYVLKKTDWTSCLLTPARLGAARCAVVN